MTTASKSVFYDGQSSVPKNIQLWFDSNTGQFTFEIENKSVDNVYRGVYNIDKERGNNRRDPIK